MKNLIINNYHLKKCFYSSINDGKRSKGNGHISNEQYLHLRNIWNTFSFNAFEDFHDHYLNMYYY